MVDGYFFLLCIVTIYSNGYCVNYLEDNFNNGIFESKNGMRFSEEEFRKEIIDTLNEIYKKPEEIKQMPVKKPNELQLGCSGPVKNGNILESIKQEQSTQKKDLCEMQINKIMDMYKIKYKQFLKSIEKKLRTVPCKKLKGVIFYNRGAIVTKRKHRGKISKPLKSLSKKKRFPKGLLQK